MSPGVFALFILAYLVIWFLPAIFFRREGRVLSLMWFFTCTPYTITPVFLTLGQLGILTPFVAQKSNLAMWLEVASVPFAAGSIALTFATMAVHRVPLALWHQKDDAPKSIVTWGPYSKVRHPFYVSFLLLSVGSMLSFPHYATFGFFVLAIVLLTFTARREEKRLLASEFGREYGDYLKRTGRFVPRLLAIAGS